MIVAGHAYGGTGNDSTIIIHLLDTSGVDIATYEFYEPNSFIQLETTSVEVDGKEIIVCGDIDLGEFKYKAFIHRIDFEGNVIRKQYYQDNDLVETVAYDLFLDDNGNYIFNVMLDKQDWSKESRAIIKLDTLGNELYRWDSEPEFFLNGPENMVVLNNGNYVIKHDTEAPNGVGEVPLMVCVDQDAQTVWEYEFSEAGFFFYIKNMFVAANGDILLCGSDHVMLDEDFFTTGFIARISQGGDLLWKRIINDATITGNFEQCSFSDIKELDNGDLVATGRFRNTNSNDLWLIRTDADGCILPDCNPLQLITSTENPPQDIAGIEVYPNPSSGIFHFTVPEMTTAWNLEVYDLVGRSIFSTDSSEGSTIDIDLSAHGSGVYIWKIGNGEGRQASGKVVKVE